jgi:protein-tyrosine phosphatase
MTTAPDRTGVLFVCLGNICRSPLAKGIFIHQARQRGVIELLDIDSCGTGPWHVGRCADSRSEEVALRHGVVLFHTARQLNPEADFARFHWLIAMDLNNRDALLDAGAPRERVHLMRTFDATLAGEPDHRLQVPDPYYGKGDGFLDVYNMLARASEGLLNAVLAHAGESGR